MLNYDLINSYFVQESQSRVHKLGQVFESFTFWERQSFHRILPTLIRAWRGNEKHLCGTIKENAIIWLNSPTSFIYKKSFTARTTMRNLPKTKSANFRFCAIISTGAVKLKPQRGRITVKAHIYVSRGLTKGPAPHLKQFLFLDIVFLYTVRNLLKKIVSCIKHDYYWYAAKDK